MDGEILIRNPNSMSVDKSDCRDYTPNIGCGDAGGAVGRRCQFTTGEVCDAMGYR